jgi:hypothetical protein
MIRNVVMAKLKPDHDADELRAVQDGFRQMNLPGTLSYTLGLDAGLRDGNWDFVIVADFADVESYRNYDLDEGHNALRARLAPMVEQIARAQIEVPDAT